jgi:putative acetyltransferase
MDVTIEMERPDTPEGRELIDELEAYIGPMYPRESQHGYTVEQLVEEGVHFFMVRVDGRPVGCGGIQLRGSEYGELKRMYIRPSHRGHGLARMLIDRLAAQAAEHDVPLLRLETGINQVEAIGLYESMGFVPVPAFPPYESDPLSVFYERSTARA